MAEQIILSSEMLQSEKPMPEITMASDEGAIIEAISKQNTKKILLINPVPASLSPGGAYNNTPLGLMAISSYLFENTPHKIRLIDCLMEETYLDLLKKELTDDVLIVGLSVMSAQVPEAIKISRLIRQLAPQAKIVWGGVHCKLYTQKTAIHPLIDVVIQLEGEMAMMDLIYYFGNNLPLNPSIKNIAYKNKSGEVVITPRAEFFDMNKLPLIHYELLNPKVLEKKSMNINTSRGCPHRCTFCINVVTKDLKYRPMSPERVVQQIEHLINNYDTQQIYFRDENFFVNSARAEKIFDLLIEKGIKRDFRFTCRADYFRKGIVHERLLEKMKKCGVYHFCFGIESGSETVLKKLKKDITKDDVILAVNMLKKYGIGGSFSFMTALPEESMEEVMETVNFIKEITRLYPGFMVSYNGKKIAHPYINVNGPQVFRPYPGGELYETVVKKYKWEEPNTLEEWELYFTQETRYTIEDYPWVKKPKMFAALQFYVGAGRYNFKGFIEKITAPYPLKLKISFFLIYWTSRLRMLLNYFDFPFEYYLGKKLGIITRYET
ncbi:B12-binding domain-containing radical SAM protein [Candidatus Woesearchaeota archaeon]|nr:B12-binding domain-containing radical SAM protein [Candidatus Woesearchaeota archaeon]